MSEKPDFTDALAGLVPSWALNLSKLSKAESAAWDERVRRIETGAATATDLRVQEAAIDALRGDRPLPPEARRMPTEPALEGRRTTWRPSTPENIEVAIGIGIPPLIAERVVLGQDITVTRSTRACAKVGTEYQILVLIGERGCGKSFAAADWLWCAESKAPPTMRAKLTPRRFLEAPLLAAVEFEDRPKLGFASVLVIDDAGTEKDFLIPDLAQLLIARYRNALPTVVTTNLSEKEFSERYGMRFADRMRETGRFVVASNDAADSLRGRA
jgi:hypothetical protein